MNPRYIKNLRTFVSVADHGGFGAGGEAIGLTQPVVSMHIKALEDALGAKLFDRRRRPPALNARGTALVVHAREIVRLCGELEAAIAPDAIAGVLALHAIPTVLTGVLPDAIVRVRRLYPELVVTLSSGTSDEVVGAVQAGRVDAGIVTEPLRLSGGLSWHPFDAEPLMAIGPASAAGETDRELLESRPFIRFKRYGWAGRLIDSRLRDRRISLRSTLEVDSLEAIMMMVSRGLGVSVVPRRSMASPFPAGVREVPFGSPPVKRVIGLVEHTGSPKAHVVAALRDVLRDVCESHRERAD